MTATPAAAAAASSRLRPAVRSVRARELLEGAGVLIRRAVGTPALQNLDPFLMLDHISSTVEAAEAGFPEHPHRGQTTVSIMLRGGMMHRDSLGNVGEVRGGGVQVMRAGAGIVHSEHPTRGGDGGGGGGGGGSGGEIEGFQLWVNLPAAQKRLPPGYQDVERGGVPTAALEGIGGATARVIAGTLRLGEGVAGRGEAAAGEEAKGADTKDKNSSATTATPTSATTAPTTPTTVTGPARIAPPDVLLLDVTVPAGATARIPLDDAFAAFAYFYEAPASGSATFGGLRAEARHAAVLSDPTAADETGEGGARGAASFSHVVAEAGGVGGGGGGGGGGAALKFLLVAGRPIGEPIVQHGPFVMNTRAEIELAFREYSEGTFVKHDKSFDPFAAAAAAAPPPVRDGAGEL